jgi:hypothetical protein
MKKLIKTNKVFVILSIFLITIFSTQQAKACEIKFDIVQGEKSTYNQGDTIVMIVKVSLTHRSCPVALKKTEFKMNGLKVIGATEWKQLSAMEYERKLKSIVLSNKDGKIVISAIRTCDKDGGFGSLELKAVPKKD